MRHLLVVLFLQVVLLPHAVAAPDDPAPACASGLSRVYTIFATSGTGGASAPPCAVGAQFSSMAALNAACTRSGSAAPTATWATVVDSTVWSVASSSPPTHQKQIKQRTTNNSTGSLQDNPGANWTVRSVCQSVTCEAPDGTDLGFLSTASYDSGLTTACVDDCKAIRVLSFNMSTTVGGEGTGVRWSSTGENCTGEPSADGQGDLCITAEGGMTVCANKDQPELVSDGKLPVEDTPDPEDWTYSGSTAPNLQDQGCVVLESGGAFCVVSAPNQPDNGNPGQTATPTGQVTYAPDYGGGTTYNYYSSTTVTSSSNYGNGAGNGECNPATTNCNGVGDPNGQCDPVTDSDCRADGKGTISGGNNCSAPPVCNNDPIQCYHSTRLWELKCALATPSDGSLQTMLNAGVDDGLGLGPGQSLVPQIGEDQDVSAWFAPSVSSAACPDDLVIDLWLGPVVIPLSQWCGLLRTIGLFVLAAAALQAFRIFAQGFN